MVVIDVNEESAKGETTDLFFVRADTQTDVE